MDTNRLYRQSPRLRATDLRVLLATHLGERTPETTNPALGRGLKSAGAEEKLGSSQLPISSKPGLKSSGNNTFPLTAVFCRFSRPAPSLRGVHNPKEKPCP